MAVTTLTHHDGSENRDAGCEPGDQPLQRTLPRAGRPRRIAWPANLCRPGGLRTGSPPLPLPRSIRPTVRRLPQSLRLSGPGRYLAGAECDGAIYPAMATAGDRNRVRQIVLKNLGWTIRQVWSTDDFIDTDAAPDRVPSVRVAQARVPAERERRRREDPCRAQAATTGHEHAARRGLPPCRDGAKKGDRIPRCRRPRAEGRSLPGEARPGGGDRLAQSPSRPHCSGADRLCWRRRALRRLSGRP